MTEVRPDERYSDFIDATSLQKSARIKESSYDLNILFQHVRTAPTGILEIGSGIGFVTQALKSMYPTLPLLAMDNSRDARVIDAAQTNNVFFLHKDASSIDNDFLKEILANGINTIVAMRLPGDIIVHLWELLERANFQGNFIASVVAIPQEAAAMRSLARKHYQTGQAPLILREDFLLSETGYVATFPLADETEVK